VEVYLALLPMKVARASAIAKAGKQSRSHTYLVLRSLEEKGLVSEVERGNILHFVIESPRRLLSYVRDRERELKELEPLIESALPYLQSLTPSYSGEPRVTKLKGIEGLRQVYREMLPQDFCGLFNPEAMYKAFGKHIAVQLLGHHEPLRGRDLLVDNAAARQHIRDVPPHEHYAIRLLPTGVTFSTDTIVAGDQVTFLAYDSEQTIVQIENRNIADAFRAWFEVLWGAARAI
jgi:predicted transcriptional regulator